MKAARFRLEIFLAGVKWRRGSRNFESMSSCPNQVIRLGGMVKNASEMGTMTGRRKWVARVDAGVHLGFLIVVVVVIWQSQMPVDFWNCFGH
jgi:hypothetical protein